VLSDLIPGLILQMAFACVTQNARVREAFFVFVMVGKQRYLGYSFKIFIIN